jgi:dynein heavy chain
MDNSEETRLHRIYICLDAEDPKKYIERVSNAFKERIYADTIIKYNYYIDNMPREDLAELDTE